MKTNALLIFTRNPELGKVKTRLAKTIGDVDALQVYKDLLLHTMEQTEHLTVINLFSMTMPLLKKTFGIQTHL